MACCLRPLSLITVWWHSPKTNFTEGVQDTNSWHTFESTFVEILIYLSAVELNGHPLLISLNTKYYSCIDVISRYVDDRWYVSTTRAMGYRPKPCNANLCHPCVCLTYFLQSKFPSESQLIDKADKELYDNIKWMVTGLLHSLVYARGEFVLTNRLIQVFLIYAMLFMFPKPCSLI